MKLVATAALLVVPALAYADDPAPSRVAAADPAGYDNPAPSAYDAPPMPPGLAPVVEAPAPPPKPVDPMLAASKIVGAGHGLVVGSALTTPNGQIELGVRSIPPFAGMLELSTGITSTTEISVDAGTTFVDGSDSVSALGANLKQVIGRGQNWQLALLGSVHRMGDRSNDGATMYSGGGIATLCTDDNCGLMMNAGLHFIGITDEQDTLTMFTFGISAGSRTTRFLAELMVGSAGGNDNGALGFLGVRLGGRTTAVDLGLATVFDNNGSDAPVVPMLSLLSRL